MKKALLVDDSEPNRNLLGSIISNLGLSVEYAEDGDVAVHKFADTKPDIVFIDQIMPRKNGADAIKQMKLITQDFTAILMSSLTDPDEIQEIVESCGAEEFMKKPFSPEVISRIITKYRCIE